MRKNESVIEVIKSVFGVMGTLHCPFASHILQSWAAVSAAGLYNGEVLSLRPQSSVAIMTKPCSCGSEALLSLRRIFI